MNRKPRFSDLDRQPLGGYVDSKGSAEPGYLAAKFARIIEQQTRDAAEVQVKVAPMKRQSR